MALTINDTAPDFEANTTEGPIRFHEWLGDSWGVLFSHPKDFTPVCTTELGRMAALKPEFDKRGVKVIGLSVDPVDNHKKWSIDIAETQGFAPNYPMIGDTELKVSKLYGMLPAGAGETSEGRTPADNATSQALESAADATTVRLQGLSGAEFDRAYIDNEVAFHQQVLDAIDTTLLPHAQNAELKSLIEQVRPAIAGHLEMARQVQTSLPK